MFLQKPVFAILKTTYLGYICTILHSYIISRKQSTFTLRHTRF